MTKNNDQDLGMLAHLLSIFTGFIAPLIIFLILKDKKNIGKENARHALNFQISLVIYWIIVGILFFILIGFILAPILWIFSLVVMIMGSVRAARGEVYKYPLEIQFIAK